MKSKVDKQNIKSQKENKKKMKKILQDVSSDAPTILLIHGSEHSGIWIQEHKVKVIITIINIIIITIIIIIIGELSSLFWINL